MKNLVSRNNDSSKIVGFDFELPNLFSARCQQNIENQVILCASAKSSRLQILPHMDSKLSERKVRLQRYVFIENELIFFVVPQNLSGSSSCSTAELIANPSRKTSSKPGTGHSGGKIYRYEIPSHVLTMGAYPSTKMMTIPTGSTCFM